MEGGSKTTGVTADLPTKSTRAPKAKDTRETPRYILTREHQSWPKPWSESELAQVNPISATLCEMRYTKAQK